MRLKNLICIGLSIAMIASAAGCGSSVSESPSAGGQTAAEAEAEASAASAALNSFNKILLADHIRTCVADDVRNGGDEKLEELLKLLQKLMK